MTADLPLIKSVHTPLTTSVFFFLPLGLSAGMSAADPEVQY